jgi:hypothetical protein
MRSLFMRIFGFVLIFALGSALPGGLLRVDANPLFASVPQKSGTSAASVPGEPGKRAHQDHNPKHGGIFFMCLDNKHHLEGVLLPSGTFRLYLYDAHTKPLKADQTKEAGGSVQIGESDSAPKIALGPSKKEEALEANLGEGMKFPVTLTVMIHLPGMPPHTRPELFTFKFSKFTDENSSEACVPSMKMQGMCP